MKTVNLIKSSAVLLIAGVISSLVACGSKGGDSMPAANTYGYGSCVNCQNINGGSSFFTAQSTDSYGVILLSMNFSGQTYGQPAVNQPYPTPYANQYGQQQYYGQPIYSGGYNYGYGTGYGAGYGNNPVTSYSGPVAVNGQFIVSQGMNLGYCQLPVGTYALTTLQAGQWNMGIIYNLRMQATGAANIVLSISPGQVSAKSGYQTGYTWNEVGNAGRIFGNLVVESVNGYPCQMSILVQ